jgi:RNA polymerase sigma factor (TIGR02999 family)
MSGLVTMSDPFDTEDLLGRAKAGDSEAANELVLRIYTQLHTIAQTLMRRERRDHTLQATAVLHEALVRLFKHDHQKWPDNPHSMILFAARAMKQVLTDHARARAAVKRKPPGSRVILDEIVDAFERKSPNLVALGDALDRLELYDPTAARLVQLRFYAGLSMEEAAKVLGTSVRTAERDWRAARAWLRREIQ